MATHTVSIPQQTIPANSKTLLGSLSTNQSLTSAAITISRTVAGGLNSLTSAVTFVMETDLSFDAGVTWTPWSSVTTQGGNVPDDFGNPEPTQIDNFTFNPPIPHKTEGRTFITCTAAVVIVGSVTLTD